MNKCILCFVLWVMAGCGSKSFFDCENPVKGVPCRELTAEENGKKSIRKGDYSTAVIYLEEAIEELLNQEDLSLYEKYRLHPLLASVYGAKAGIDLVELSQTQMGGDQSILTAISMALPHPKEKSESEYRQCLSDVKSGSGRLDQIPQGLLAELESEAFGKSVLFQKTLYHTAYSVMMMNLFAVSPITGTFDKDQLANMTEADALEILASLEAAGKVPQTDNPLMQQKIQETLSQIDGEQGAGKKEKLAEYIDKNR
jgi:hypothetical protein